MKYLKLLTYIILFFLNSIVFGQDDGKNWLSKKSDIVSASKGDAKEIFWERLTVSRDKKIIDLLSNKSYIEVNNIKNNCHALEKNYAVRYVEFDGSSPVAFVTLDNRLLVGSSSISDTEVSPDETRKSALLVCLKEKPSDVLVYTSSTGLI